MVTNVRSRLAKLEEARPQREVVPEILDTDTPEQASKIYKQLVGIRGQLRKASPDEQAEIDNMTEAQASEMYYAAVPYARRESVPVVVVNAEGPHAPVSVSDDDRGIQSDAWAWLDDAGTWEAAHPNGPAYADRHEMPAPEEYAHVSAELREALDLPPINEQPEPPPLVAIPEEPISDDDNWLML
ncbi:hypothetical protein [Aeromonas sp. QDB03]|uniref:hypothetical protein n=1 Tax=Aeromonas sp. QDB03 TaxID=2989839 RepID=UPI0022E7E8BA|nr:hypothetical protein [Aeromonas sp. QDB03]